MEKIKKVGIVGAGTMGLGIAQISALAGFDVILYDLDQAILNKAVLTITSNLDKGIERGKVESSQKEKALARIKTSTKISDLGVDLVIEAAVEKLAVKIKLFEELEGLNSKKTIFATNTSSIPISRIAAGLEHPERVVGLHFFNPAHIMKLVEVISGVATSQEVADAMRQFAEALGKTVVEARDSPGFIVNRVARHFYVESLKVLEENVSDVSTIDQLMEASGFKMGPFRLMDLIGVDTNFSVTKSMFDSFHQDEKFRPSRIQQQKVDAGHWGRKSGLGFYDYD